MDNILEVLNLEKRFPVGRGKQLHAVNNVSLSIAPGEIVGLVGESGSGKSTIGRLVTGLLKPSGGDIRFEDRDLNLLSARVMRRMRSQLQIVFQDPWSSLNPRMRIRDLIEEPFLLHTTMSRSERRKAVDDLVARVRLNTASMDRYPVGLSGGQLQRVCIARALATKPRLIVLDEPTSSLDLSVRADILDLLNELRSSLGTSMLFISHDLATIRFICDRVLVLYLGRVIEDATVADLFRAPVHPYTRGLLSAQLSPDPNVRIHRQDMKGEIPSPIDLPPGCSFESRCRYAKAECKTIYPELDAYDAGHRVACIRKHEIPLDVSPAP